MGPIGATSTVTSENLFTDQDSLNDGTTEENTTTEHEDDINQSTTIKETPLLSTGTINQILLNKQNEMYLNKNVNLDVNFNNNLQSNDIPKLVDNSNYLSSDLSDKLEDEKNKQHKLMHDEFARHGNFETIFTQPTDHFVPPLVMAKAKLSDDMTVLSLEEKHAQQLAEQRYAKQFHEQDHNRGSITSTIGTKTSIDELNNVNVTDKPLIIPKKSIIIKDDMKKDVLKTFVHKKYSDKTKGSKSKNFKVMDSKLNKIEKSTEFYSTSTTESVKYVSDAYSDMSEEEPTIDLTVIIKEPDVRKYRKAHTNFSSEIPKIEIIQNDTSISEPEIKLKNPVKSSGEITQEISVKLPTKSMHNLTLSHEVIKITILKEDNASAEPTVFEVTTKMPIVNDDNSIHSTLNDVTTKDNTATSNSISSHAIPTKDISGITAESSVTTSSVDSMMSTSEATVENISPVNSTTKDDQILTTKSIPVTSYSTAKTIIETSHSVDKITTTTPIRTTSEKETEEVTTESEDTFESNTTDTSQTIDDFQSPLLSAANEPLHRPNRSRRPQPPPNRNKFNPFRILG